MSVQSNSHGHDAFGMFFPVKTELLLIDEEKPMTENELQSVGQFQGCDRRPQMAYAFWPVVITWCFIVGLCRLAYYWFF